MRKHILSLGFILLLASMVLAANIPTITRPVTDLTGTLLQSEITGLESKIRQHEDITSNQIAIVMIPSLEGRAINDVSMEIADKWRGGEADKDNGVLILVAKNDRKLRFEVGRGLEGPLPDLLCKTIIDAEITPYFKTGDFYNGLDNGLDKTFLAIKNEYKAAPGTQRKPQRRRSSGRGLSSIIFFILYALFGGFNRYGRRRRRYYGGHMGMGGFYGGGGGGGFSGGGGFGGGGASGGW